ncbi:MAG: NUDIX domain-containing protein [Richelia sp. RM2_1_2]|nr:NUDIX domain-containing protein [Richelia sp. RM2_1_2]
MENIKQVGVLIGRFQTPELHNAHNYLIETVLEKHDKVIIFLGTSKVKLSRIHTLDFETRKLMLEEKIGDKAKIIQLNDMPRRDDLWSLQVDTKILAEFPDHTAILYGSRDSFIPFYCGKFKTEYIEAMDNSVSGTDLRNEVSKKPLPSKDFRSGIIYNSFNKYPIVYSTVDVAIFNDDETKILMGRKLGDPIGIYRFVGGFVDPNDENELQTVRREGFEETNATIEPYEFVTSMMVRNDPRYKREPDQSIMTHLYKARYIYGQVKGSDDLAEVIWFDVSDVKPEMFVGEHQPLWNILKTNLEKSNKSLAL